MIRTLDLNVLDIIHKTDKYIDSQSIGSYKLLKGRNHLLQDVL